MPPLIALYIVDGITALLLIGGLFICARKGLFGLFAYPAGLLGSFLFEYQLFSPAYGLAMRGLSGLLPILADPAAYAAAEIAFSVVYETLVFMVIALVCRRRMRFSTAGAFGFGWWSCFALFTLVSRISDLVSGEQYLFIGTALEVFLSRITIPLSLGLYMFLALSACRCVAEGRVVFLFRAFLMALLYRGVLALPTFFPFSEAVAVALAAILAFRMLSVLIGHGIASDFFTGALRAGSARKAKGENAAMTEADPLPGQAPAREETEEPGGDPLYGEPEEYGFEDGDEESDEAQEGDPLAKTEEDGDEEPPRTHPSSLAEEAEDDAEEPEVSAGDDAAADGEVRCAPSREGVKEDALSEEDRADSAAGPDGTAGDSEGTGEEDGTEAPGSPDLLRREDVPEEEPMFDLFEREKPERRKRKGLFGGKRRNQ